MMSFFIVNRFIRQLPEFIVTLIIKLCFISVIIFATRWILKKLSHFIIDLCSYNNIDEHTCIIFGKITRYVIISIAATIILQNLGINTSAFLTFFGITGIVLSYGMKDIVANFIASILIIGYKHIKINDQIKTKDWQGKVIDINLRYTTLKTQHSTIFIPNIVLYTEPVEVLNDQESY